MDLAFPASCYVIFSQGSMGDVAWNGQSSVGTGTCLSLSVSLCYIVLYSSVSHIFPGHFRSSIILVPWGSDLPGHFGSLGFWFIGSFDSPGVWISLHSAHLSIRPSVHPSFLRSFFPCICSMGL